MPDKTNALANYKQKLQTAVVQNLVVQGKGISKGPTIS
jgi:hypothetical protein